MHFYVHEEKQEGKIKRGLTLLLSLAAVPQTSLDNGPEV